MLTTIKDRIIRWSIKQIVADSTKTYGGMRYLEDVMTNKFGEQMFIFSHRLVPIKHANQPIKLPSAAEEE